MQVRVAPKDVAQPVGCVLVHWLKRKVQAVVELGENGVAGLVEKGLGYIVRLR